MSWREIRPVALGAVRRDDELLVAEFDDPETGGVFYRLLGGGVEFGEHSRDTVVREFEEELGVQFRVDRCIGTFEDVFEFDGEPAHEIWRVYMGDIAEDWPYEQSSFDFREPDLDVTLTAHWLSMERLRADVTFYDPAVLDALDAEHRDGGDDCPTLSRRPARRFRRRLRAQARHRSCGSGTGC